MGGAGGWFDDRAWRGTPLVASDGSLASLGSIVVYGGTLAFLLVFAALVFLGDPDTVDLVFGWLLPVSLLAVLVHFDRSVVPTAMDDHLARIGSWFATGAVALALATAGTLELLLLKGGTVLNVDVLVLVYAGVGSVVGYVVGIYDVDRLRETQRAERLHAQASVLNRVLRHDIRNDATVIRGYADLIGTESDVDGAKIETIEQRVDDIVSLSETARKLERVMAAGEGEVRTVDLGRVVAEQTARVEKSFPEVAVHHADSGSVPVRAHELLDSAIYNVVSNAAEHNDADEPRVEVTVDRPDDRWAVVTVADNGPGIPDEEREVLTTGSETALSHSNGLGLWLANWIVTRSEGSLAIQDRDPRGTRVRLSFRRDDVSRP